MCGIAGIYKLNENVQLEYNSKVLDILQHRGPDAQQYYAFDDAIFYHTRLAIIDLSEHAHQPYFLNKNKCIVFNGEIFNYLELSHKIGITCPKSDTEVLIHYFDKYKTDGLHQINGFFAFAFYDGVDKEMYLVRDRYGEKPLYYYYDNHLFAFASEIHPLLELVQKKLSINWDALYTYFRLHYIAGNESIFSGIQKLLPGHYIHIKNNIVSLHQWYELEKNNHSIDVSIKELLSDAVQKRLISDVPVGAFLSGGVDSSVVCALAKNYVSELHTFSLGYQDAPLYNETQDAKKVADYIKSHHHHFEISTHEIVEHIPEILQSFDEPFADSSAINVYFISKKMKPYATVALSGDGSDELLMGYNKHKVFLYHHPIIKFLVFLLSPIAGLLPESRSIPLLNSIRKIKKLAIAQSLSPLKKFIYLSQWTDEAYIFQLLHINTNNWYFYHLFNKYQHLDEVKLFNLADIEIVLANDMLYKIDFFGMWNAVEIRSPFLDHRVVEYLYHSPFDCKIYEGQQKYILRKNFSNLLPEFIFSKKKKGFEVPLHKILTAIVEQDILLSSDYIEQQGIFNYSMIHQLKTQLPQNLNDSALKLWTILVFQHWYKKFEKYIQKHL